MAEPKTITELLGAILGQVGEMFRHLLPGVLVVGAAAAAHPKWFETVNWSNPWHLVALAAIAVTAGNTWYVFHRYISDQGLDRVWYMLRRDNTLSDGGWRRRLFRKATLGYLRWISRFVQEGHAVMNHRPEMKRYVRLWASSVILLFIFSEVTILFARWNDNPSFFHTHPSCLLGVGIMFFALSILLQCLLTHLDIRIVRGE